MNGKLYEKTNMSKLASVVENVIVDGFLPFLRERMCVDMNVLISAWQEFNVGECSRSSNFVERVDRESKETLDSSVETKNVFSSMNQEPSSNAPLVKYASSSSQKDLFENDEEKRGTKRPVTATQTAEDLEHLKIKDLKAICESMHISKGGVKQSLIKRILEAKTPSLVFSSTADRDLLPPAKKLKTFDNERTDDVAVNPSVCKEGKKKEEQVKIGKLRIENYRLPDVEIHKNESGHWINNETKIVFTSDEEFEDGVRCRLAIGFEDEDGHVEELTAEKIELCNQYGFRYREPSVISC